MTLKEYNKANSLLKEIENTEILIEQWEEKSLFLEKTDSYRVIINEISIPIRSRLFEHILEVLNEEYSILQEEYIMLGCE